MKTDGRLPAGAARQTDPRETAARVRSGERGRVAALCVAGFLTSFLLLNTYYSFGGTWGIAWILGCAGCTVPLPLVWVQEVLVLAGIGVVLARVGMVRPPLPGWVFRSGLWTMAAVFGAVALQNLLGDNTPQARFLFAPLALTLCAATAFAARELAAGERQ